MKVSGKSPQDLLCLYFAFSPYTLRSRSKRFLRSIHGQCGIFHRAMLWTDFSRSLRQVKDQGSTLLQEGTHWGQIFIRERLCGIRAQTRKGKLDFRLLLFQQMLDLLLQDHTCCV